MNSKKYKIIDIFSGCGGFSTGFEQSGAFTNVLAIDIWNIALETIKINKAHTKTICSPLENLSNEEIIKIKDEYGDIEVVVGGPPCQGFSLAGKRQKDDPRNNLWQEYIRFISIIKPNWFVFENVSGLISMKNHCGEKIINLILKEFSKIGYQCEINLISAKDFNVAQDRKRILIIGNKEGKSLKLKPVTKNKAKTVRNVISDLESLRSSEKSKIDHYHFAMKHNENHLKWLDLVPEGETAHNYKHITGMTAKGYSTTYKRIWWADKKFWGRVIQLNITILHQATKPMKLRDLATRPLREGRNCLQFRGGV
jgi:DNA (cytosine-5)-methyltransferase 1